MLSEYFFNISGFVCFKLKMRDIFTDSLNVQTNNRMVKTAQGSSAIEPDMGFGGERALAYYKNPIKGGIGLMVEGTSTGVMVASKN